MAISNFIITGEKEWETYKLCYEWEIIILKSQETELTVKNFVKTKYEKEGSLDTMARFYLFFCLFKKMVVVWGWVGAC